MEQNELLIEILELIRSEKSNKEIKEQFINQYKLINELCKNNNTYPFFKDPTNIAECEKTRLDLVRIIPEEIINKLQIQYNKARQGAITQELIEIVSGAEAQG